MAFADTVGAVATVLNLPPGASTTTLESKTNFFAAGRAGVVRAEATPLHRGRRTMVWQTRVTDEGGRLLSLTTQTQMVLPERELSVTARSSAPARSTVPDTCSWVVTVRDGAAVALRGDRRIPTRAARSATRSTASWTTRARPTGCSTRCGASARRARAASRASRGTRRSTRSRRGGRRSSPAHGGAGDLALPGHRQHGHAPGRAGCRPAALERARHLAAHDDHLHDRRRLRHRLHARRQPGRHGPGDASRPRS